MLSPEEVERRKAELEERRELKQKYRRRQYIMYAIIAIFGILLMVFTAHYSYQRSMVNPVSQISSEDRRIHILFLGTDKISEANSRADTILLVSLDPKTGHAGVLSIPRDTRVWVPSRERWDRVNATYAYGGPELTMEVVSLLLNVPVEYYVQTDFQGFEKIIDILGGVEITIEREMAYEDQAQDLYIHLMPGKQVLDGERALQYVRYRDRLGDIALVNPYSGEYDGRVERQRNFLGALANKVLSASTIPKLPQLINQTAQIVDTNIPWDEVLGLTLSSTRFSADKVSTAVLPGNSQVVNGAWYWIVDERKAESIVSTLVWGKPAPLRLTVLNGNGRTGIAQQVSDLLRENGYDVVSVGNAQHFDFAETQIIVSPDDVSRVHGLALKLGATITVQDGDNSVDKAIGSPVTIIVGKDFTTANRSVEI